MNKIYKLIWNTFTSSWVAVAEFVKAKGKKSVVILIAFSISNRLNYFIPEALAGPIAPPAENQLPTQGSIIQGIVTINELPNLMDINQDSAKAILNWGTFNLGSAATVNFNQPSPSAVILNNILDSNPSQIYGHINANGQVFFSNPNGMYFSPSSSVSVGGLVATTNSINNDDFMAGRYNFYRNSATGSIINEGKLTSSLGGYIALLAPEVRNHGVVIAQLGSVVMAAGDTYTLEFKNGSTLTNVYVSASTLNTLVSNGQAIYAPGGLVILSAKAANQIQGGVINNTGFIEASGLTDHGGIIRLEASNAINHSGNIKANAAPSSKANGGNITLIADLTNSASFVKVIGAIYAEGGNLGGNGGFIETSGSKVKIEDGASISTHAPLGKNGEWLLDPVNFLVASSGGDITGDQLSELLLSSDVTLQTITGANTSANRYGVNGSDGNITVNDSITWSENKLTLNAANNIYINSALNGSGTASLSLLYGQDGGDSNYFINAPVNLPTGNNFSTQKGTAAGSLITYQVINDIAALQGIDVSTNFALGSDLTFTPAYSFTPLENLEGKFDGLGHTISNLTITGGGLFENTLSNAVIQNINLNANVNGSINVGGIVGSNEGLIFNSSFNGTVAGDAKVGGLAGFNSGTILSSYVTTTSSTDIQGILNTGGLVGYNDSSGVISDSYLLGNFGSSEMLSLSDPYLINTGGLVGYNLGDIQSSYVTGNVAGGLKVGGLVGNNYGGSSNNSYVTGNTSGVFKVGGITGSDGFSIISIGLDSGKCSAPFVCSSGQSINNNVYGDVNGFVKVGGLNGLNLGSIDTNVIRGNVSGQLKVGGLAATNGLNLSQINSSDIVLIDSYISDLGLPFLSGSDIQELTQALYSPDTFDLTQGSISNSAIYGNVSGNTKVGGLTALNAGSVFKSNVNGNVSGVNLVGGLTAVNAGSINQGYINGSVSGQNKVGLLSQANFNGSSITNSYQLNTNIEQPIPSNLALNEFDPLINRKAPKKINSDELINYEAIRSNITVRAKVIIR